MKSRPLTQLAEDIVPYIEAKGYPVPSDKQWLEKMIATLRERAKTLAELVDAAHYYLSDEVVLEPKAAAKFLTKDVATPIRTLIQKLALLSNFVEPAIEQAFSTTLNEYQLPMGKLAQPVRVALTGNTVSPGIHDVIAVLGKERTIARLERALEFIRQLDSTR